MALKSWTCKGCTNWCYMLLPNGEVYKYCRAVVEKGKNRTRWIGDYIECMDYTTDPDAEDKQVRLYSNKGEVIHEFGN